MLRSQESERPFFATIRYDVAERLDITWNEYILLDMVAVLSMKHGYCYKSLTSIARDMRMTYTGTKKMMARLVERELLIPHQHGYVAGQSYLEIVNTDKRDKVIESELSTKTELSSLNRGGILNSVQKSELSTVEKYSKKNTTSKSKNSDARRLIDFWNKTYSSNIKCLDGRIKKTSERLKVFTAKEIAFAIYNAKNDPFFMGEGPRGWVGNYDYLVNSDQNIEKYLQFKPRVKSTYA